MAYPAYYNPYMQQNFQPPQNSLIWVQGEAGANSYLVAPGSTVQLWDSERQTIYLKSADASGFQSMKILDYTIRETSGQTGGGDYATREDIAALTKQIEALKTQLEGQKHE